MIVMKFGGSSVANRAQIEKVREIVESRLERRPVVVCSAHKGMTDALVNSARNALQRKFELPDVIDLQSEIAAGLDCPQELLAELYQDISDLLRGIGLVGELSPRSMDFIASFGERMSVRCVADFFTRQGLKSRAYDVWDLGFITDANFGCARPLEGFKERAQKAFAELVPPDVVPIVTGFVGQTPEGEITTVGRNGSDLTATLLGAALGVEEVEIWTDTNGVMTADPSVVAQARNIPTMRFDEAAELARFGGRVLHPSTLLPAMEGGIPVRVLNTNQPDHPGTVINQKGDPERGGVTSVAYKENQGVLTITSTSMLAQAGFLAHVFNVLAKHGVVVDVVSTSEITISMTTSQLKEAEKALQELSAIGTCELQKGKTVLVVVGQKLAERKGVSARVMATLTEAGVKVDMLSFGKDSINFSVVLDDSDIDRAVPVLHKALFQ